MALKRTLTLAVLLVAAAPSTAHAGWKIERATMIAGHVWHQPCGGDVELRWGESPELTIGMWTDPGVCAVNIGTHIEWDWIGFCSYLLHEYGHLANYRDPTNTRDPTHSRSERSIMALWLHDDRRCRNRGRPFLERHGLLPRRNAAQPRRRR